MPATQLRPKSFVKTVTELSRTIQFYWFVGHVLSLVFFAWSRVLGFFSKTKSLRYYQLTLLCVVFTYGIVIKQIHFKSGGLAGIKRKNFGVLLKDENVQYLGLAITFLLSSVIIGEVSGGLYSIQIFSVFHVLSYFQNYILSSLPISISAQQVISTRINYFTSNFNQQALAVAANLELFMPLGFILLIPTLIFKLFRNPLYVFVTLQVFAYIVVFIKLRYNDNKYTQAVVQQLDYKILSFVNHPRLQAYPLAQIYEQTVKGLIRQYLGPILINPTTKKTN